MWKLIFFIGLAVHCALSTHIKSTHTPVAEIADSVVYDKARNCLYYVDYGTDSQDPCIFRYDITNKETYSAYIKGPSLGSPGFIVPNKDGKTFTVGFKKFVGIVRWNGKKRSAKLVRELYRGGPGVVPDLGPNERIYVGHRDPTGNALYAGTIDLAYCGVPANQSVHVKRRDAQQERVLGVVTRTSSRSRLTLPIGYAYTKGCVYILDACQLKLWAIPDPDSKCENSKCDEPYVVIDFAKDGKTTDDFFPAGLEADSKGILYTANYFTGCIYAINPCTRKYRKVAKLPVKGPTSLSFGDDNGKGQNLYVSVASRIRNVNNGQLISSTNPKSAIYKIIWSEDGVEFKRYKP